MEHLRHVSRCAGPPPATRHPRPAGRPRPLPRSDLLELEAQPNSIELGIDGVQVEDFRSVLLAEQHEMAAHGAEKDAGDRIPRLAAPRALAVAGRNLVLNLLLLKGGEPYPLPPLLERMGTRGTGWCFVWVASGRRVQHADCPPVARGRADRALHYRGPHGVARPREHERGSP